MLIKLKNSAIPNVVMITT